MSAPSSFQKIPSASKLSRLIKISQMLSCDRFVTKGEIAGKLEVSSKTIQRDVTALITYFNAPIEISNQGYIYTEPNFLIPASTMTERELFALLIAEKTLKEYRGTPFEDALRGAFYKLTALLDDDILLDLTQRSEAFHFDFDSPRHVNPEVMQAVSDAYCEKKTLMMDYYSAHRGKTERRKVDIYKILNLGEDWYVIGNCHKHREVRIFALSRMSNTSVFDTGYMIPDDFNVDIYLGESFSIYRGDETYEVVVWFDEYQARWIRERDWHGSQRIEEHKDGSLTIRFEVTGLAEVKRWVLSYGEHAKVLSPHELVEGIRGSAGKAMEHYK